MGQSRKKYMQEYRDDAVEIIPGGSSPFSCFRTRQIAPHL